MRLSNEDETRDAIEEWRSFSPAGQTVNLRKAIEAMELDQMYYEQKGRERGVERCEACLLLLKERQAEIS